MIKNILLIFLTLCTLWLLKDHFGKAAPKTLHQNQKDTSLPTETNSQHEQYKKIKQHVSHAEKTNKPTESFLATLLKNGKFYDALAYYLEHGTKTNQVLLENYLATLAKNNPRLALEYMPVYLDEMPQSKIKNALISTYIQTRAYAKAIDKIMEAKENTLLESEEKRLSAQLKKTAITYIDDLVQKKEYATLIEFLENMIAYDEDESFYRFRLAQLYLELDKTSQATPLLDSLQYDEVYAQKAKSYMASLTLDEDESEKYEYAIPLGKYGNHYVVDVVLDGEPFRLMLDTGASYIYVDENKASILDVINPNLRLQTAGGDVDAKLCRASTMRVGNLELSNIQVTTAPFEREEIDGLLGMNFLNRFAFYIDQEKNILYLNTK